MDSILPTQVRRSGFMPALSFRDRKRKSPRARIGRPCVRESADAVETPLNKVKKSKNALKLFSIRLRSMGKPSPPSTRLLPDWIEEAGRKLRNRAAKASKSG